MDYQELYQKKLTSAEHAVETVKSGDWVDYGWTTGTPEILDRALAARYEELRDVKVRGGIILKIPKIMQVSDVKEHFIWNSWHSSGIERKLCADGLAFYSPLRYSELPRYYRENLTVNVAMLQVAPMDQNGMFNFGPNASHLKAVCEVADVVIVEVNENMPYCFGSDENGVHISDVTYIVEGTHDPIPEMGGAGEPTEVDLKVAGYVVPRIPDGACLQLGIGCSTWERAEKMISIAHPDFRDELIREAEKMKIWRNSNRR